MFSTIRSKLVLGFILVLLATMALGGVSYIYTQENNSLVEQAINRDFNGSIRISELAILAQKIRRYEKEYFMYIGNAEKQAKYEGEWSETFVNIEEKVNALTTDRSGMWSKADRRQFHEWKESLQAYGKGFRNVVEGVNAGELTDTLSANAAVQEAKNAFRSLVDGTIEFANKKYDDAAAAQTQIKAKSDELNWILALTVGIAALICLMLIVVMPRSITKPVKQLSHSASAMSQGDLEQPVPQMLSVQDFDDLAATLERMRISQKALIGRLSGKIAA